MAITQNVAHSSNSFNAPMTHANQLNSLGEGISQAQYWHVMFKWKLKELYKLQLLNRIVFQSSIRLPFMHIIFYQYLHQSLNKKMVMMGRGSPTLESYRVYNAGRKKDCIYIPIVYNQCAYRKKGMIPARLFPVFCVYSSKHLKSQCKFQIFVHKPWKGSFSSHAYRAYLYIVHHTEWTKMGKWN